MQKKAAGGAALLSAICFFVGELSELGEEITTKNLLNSHNSPTEKKAVCCYWTISFLVVMPRGVEMWRR
jgi:hypothetical protein